MNKNIIYNTEARDKLRKGIDKLANAVKVTLGPNGRNVVLDTGTDYPVITKDGVSVAREIYLQDPIENIGAQMMKQVSMRTNDKVGDGTTTATVLAQVLLKKGFELIEQGVSPLEINKIIKSETEYIIKCLRQLSKKIETEEEIYNIANISTNGDEELSKLISNCYKKVKDNIVFEESKSTKTYYEILEGMQYKTTYISRYLVNSKDGTFESEKSLVFIYDGKIESLKQIYPILDKVSSTDLPLVIICEDIDDNSILTLVKNKKEGNLKSVVVKSPGFGFARIQSLKDISIYTNGKIYSGTIKECNLEDLGQVDSVLITEERTIFKGDYGLKEQIKDRINELEFLKGEADESTSQMINERISKFKNGLGIIYIGANTPIELKERKDRLEDAINSVKAAKEMGVIAGGGITLALVSTLLKNSIIKETILAPYRQIQDNGGNKIKNINKREFNNYISKGIIDPVKVTITALESAVSVVTTILTTECVISYE